MSSSGTISTMSLPGCTTPPTVLASRRCTRPRTGLLTCDLSTLSASATAPSFSALSLPITSASVLARLVAEGQLGLLDLALRPRAIGRLHARDLRAGLLDVAAAARDVALEPQDVDLATPRRWPAAAGSCSAPAAPAPALRSADALARAHLAQLLLALRQLLAVDRRACVFSSDSVGLVEPALLLDDAPLLASLACRRRRLERARLRPARAGAPARARSAKPWAALSRTPEVARVSSIFSSSWPSSTTWPSRTRISETTPPSSDCTTCSWRDGITLPSPLA